MKRASIICLILVMLMAGCKTGDKDQFVRYAGDVISSLNAARPLIAQYLPGATEKIDQAVAIAEKMRTALAASQSTEAFGYLHDVIVLFEDVIEHDVPQIKDEALRAKILTALAIADIALNFLANHLPKPATVSVTQQDKVAEFAAKPVWGEKYKQ